MVKVKEFMSTASNEEKADLKVNLLKLMSMSSSALLPEFKQKLSDT
jgi:hypothetical protein